MLFHSDSQFSLSTLRRMSAVVGLVALAWALPVQAQINFTWQGDHNNNWANESNWSQTPGSGNVPNAANHYVLFNDSADRFNVDLNGDVRKVGSITVSTTNQNHAYRFFEGEIQVFGNISLSTSGLATTFDSDLTLQQAAAGTWNKDSGDMIFNGPLSGSGAITLASGSVRFNTPCPYSGTLTINNLGQATLGAGDALANATVKIDVANGLNMNGGNAKVGGLAGTGNLNIGSNTLTVGGANTNAGSYSGLLTGASGTGPRIVKADGGTLRLSGVVSSINAIEVTGGDVIIQGAAVTLNESTTNGAIVLSGGDMEISSGANVSLSAPTSSGGTAVINSRELIVNQSLLTCGRIISDAGGVVRLRDNGATPALTIGKVGSENVSSTFAGTFADANGAGTVRKIGTGALTLSGVSTNTGGFEVEGGAIGGTGSASGTTHVHSGAAIKPGSSAGVFTVEHAVFDSGSTLGIELGGLTSGTQYDVLNATGEVTLGGTLDLSYINNFTASNGSSFVILTAGTLIGEFDTVNYPDGQEWLINYDTAAGTVTVHACSDSDGDNVCDGDDACPGFDDNLDADNDRVPDDCDTCPDMPNVWNVTQDAYFVTIQSAIDAAQDDDVIELGACVFVERLLSFGSKRITLRGQGPELTAIDGQHEVGSIVWIDRPAHVTIEGLSIRNGMHGGDAAVGGISVKDSNASLTIRNAVIEGNLGFIGGGLYVEGASVQLERCIFRDNSTSLNIGPASFLVVNGGEVTFLNCLFANETAQSRLGSLQSNGPATIVTITNCTFAEFSGPSFIQAVDSTSTVNLLNCAFDDSATAFSTFNGAVLNATRCLYDGASGDNINGLPTFVDAANGDYSLAPGSLGIDAGDYDAYVTAGGGANDLGGDARAADDLCVADTGVGASTYLDIGAYEIQTNPTDTDGDGILDECDSCPEAPNVHNVTQDTYHPTIQAAVDASISGDLIEIGACTFNERNIQFADKTLTLRGQGPNQTSIDGQNVIGKIASVSGTSSVILENLSILNGMTGDGAPCAGINVVDSTASATIRNVRFAGNHGDFAGGLYVDGASVTVEHCEFRGNAAAQSLGASCFDVSGDTLVTFVNCLFEGDEASSRLAHLHANQSGDAPTVDVVNCTFANCAGQYFIHMAVTSARLNLLNCCFDDSAGILSGQGDEFAELSHCLFNNAVGFGDNIDGAPTFVDAANGDYRLAAGSPGIDAADYDAYAMAGNALDDLGGVARVVDDACVANSGVGAVTYLDVGAYEHQPGNADADNDGVLDDCDVCPGFDDSVDTDMDGVPDGCDLPLYVDADAGGANDGSSWTNAFNSLRDALTAAAQSNGVISEIRIAQGTYMPDGGYVGASGYVAGSLDRAASFVMLDGLVLKGGYAGFGAPNPDDRGHETILSGDLNHDDADVTNVQNLATEPSRQDNSLHIVTLPATQPTVMFSGLTFIGGHANLPGQDDLGGAIFMDGEASTANLEDCVLVDNFAAGYGGAISVGDMNLTRCYVGENLSTNDGGAVATGSGASTFTLCYFEGNVAGGDGGAVRAVNGNTEFTSCYFASNEAIEDGGAVDTRNGSPTFMDCLFEDNVAGEDGGAFSSGNGGPTVTRCVFKGNHCAGGVGVSAGGGAADTGNGDARFVECEFHANSSGTMGGALSLGDSKPVLINCLMVGNIATSDGGAIAAAVGHTVSGGDATIVNCTMTSNQSGGRGGAVYFRLGTNHRIENSILWGNSSTSGAGEVQAEAGIPVTIGHSDVRFSGGSGTGWDSALGTDGGGNIDADPVFVDFDGGDDTPGTPDDNLQLAGYSPCIDAADYDAYQVVLGAPVDLADATRTVDTCRADSGAGLLTYLDMGAYEFQDTTTDSDNDTVPDACDICPGGDDTVDSDNDGIPDACESACSGGAIGDVNTDGLVDSGDVVAFAEVLLDPGGATADQICAADVNADGAADGDDVQGFVELLMSP
ncbi:MAG TPA: hypothetical protein P5081_02910 [Phycisphaerae bacterium]|nr:hypothetical protein [Phycisphaerae bacterium]HRW51809.1 hypothetical protein [Phycisphaerae bacterium]